MIIYAQNGLSVYSGTKSIYDIKLYLLFVLQIFKELEKHDMGCGEGGGTDSDQVFKVSYQRAIIPDSPCIWSHSAKSFSLSRLTNIV